MPFSIFSDTIIIFLIYDSDFTSVRRLLPRYCNFDIYEIYPVIFNDIREVWGLNKTQVG